MSNPATKTIRNRSARSSQFEIAGGVGGGLDPGSPGVPPDRAETARPRRLSGFFALSVFVALIIAACGSGGGTDDWVVLDVYQEDDTWFVEYKPPERHLARTAVSTGAEPGSCASSAIPGEIVPECVHEIREANEAAR